MYSVNKEFEMAPGEQTNPEDEAEEFTMYTKQAEGRRESVAIAELSSLNQTTLSGSSQYPLPGTRIDVNKGGTYTTTRSANNLISPEEFLNEVSNTRRKLSEKLKRDKAQADVMEKDVSSRRDRQRASSSNRRNSGNRNSRASIGHKADL